MMPEEWGGTPPEGGFDAFHDLIWLDEIARLACGGKYLLVTAFVLFFCTKS
jgi:hypothetical protein